MAFPPEEAVLVSALEHYSYCPRQCYLIHVEGIFEENTFTLRGHRAHERVDQRIDRVERGVTVLRGLPIWSEEYGLIGRCDVVEREGPDYRPVEYKVGTQKGQLHASIQAAAQALCLEEMFGTEVREIGLFFVQTKQKKLVPLTSDLRARAVRCIQDVRLSLKPIRPPPPAADSRCPNCSLIDACQPFAVRGAANLRLENLFSPFPEAKLP